MQWFTHSIVWPVQSERSWPGMTRLQGSERQDEFIHIFLEFVPGGSIAQLLTRFGESVCGLGGGTQLPAARCLWHKELIMLSTVT